MLGLNVDTDALQQMAATISATESQMLQARNSALKKIRLPVRRAVLAAVAKEKNISQKSIDGRVFISDVLEDKVRLWFGTWDVSPFEIGTPRQTRVGVTVARHRYPGAFIASGRRKKQIFIRTGHRHYSTDLYPSQPWAGPDNGKNTRGRYPIAAATIGIEAIVDKVLDANEDEFRERFMKIYGQELNYFVNVKVR